MVSSSSSSSSSSSGGQGIVVLRSWRRSWLQLMVVVMMLGGSQRGSAVVEGQRVDYCFDEDYHPCDINDELGEPPDLEDDAVLHYQIAFCNRMIHEYTGDEEEDEGIIFDLTIWPIKFQDIPATSQKCHEIRYYFPHCWWCTEQPCGFGVGENRELTCNATQVELQRIENGDAIVNNFFHEDNPTQNDAITCQILVDGFIHDIEGGELENVTLHPSSIRWRVGSKEECQNFHQAYPKCYFCAEDIVSEETNYCTWDSICSTAQGIMDMDTIPDNVDMMAAEEMQSTCQELESWTHEWFPRQVFTMDLCDKAPWAIATTCPQMCHSCFNETMPPTCNDPTQLEMDNYQVAYDYFVTNHDGWVDGPVSICSHLSDLFHLLHDDNDAADSLQLSNIMDRSNHLEVLSKYRANSPHCALYREAYHQCYWCRRDIDSDTATDFDCIHEEICVDGDTINTTFVGTEAEVEEFQSACQELKQAAEFEWLASTRDLCAKAERYGKYCHCWEAETQIEYVYLGADTTTRKRVLVWMPRVAALLSFVGATYILKEVLWANSGKNRDVVYYQLLACMAIFDLITAIAWAFSTAPIPADVGYNIEGASGTDGTCTAQGFFIQLGFTSVFFNVALTMYYWLVIVKNYRELQLHAIRPLLFLPPLLLGMGLAFFGIPFYRGFEYGCHIQPVPHGELWQVLLFAVGPIGFSILLITILMIRLYVHVREQSRNSRRWRFGFGQAANMERKVFYQALFFTLSFYVTWPIVLCVYITGWDHEKQNFGFAVLVAFVAPLQGFNNAMVFIRPKLKNPIDSGTIRRSARYLSSRIFGQQEDSSSNNNSQANPFGGIDDSSNDGDDNDRRSNNGGKANKKSSGIRSSSAVRSMDPSAVIAFDEVTLARFTESIGRESTTGVGGSSCGVGGARERIDGSSGADASTNNFIVGHDHHHDCNEEQEEA